MFSFFKKKPSNRVPTLTPEVLAVRDQTIDEVRRQAAIYFKDPMLTNLPELDTFHRRNIAAYASGFVTGMLQVTEADRHWAPNDENLQHVIWLGLCAGVFYHIFGEQVSMEMISALKDQGRQLDATWMQMDGIGGTDGMAHAMKEPKQKGGLLLHYFKSNLE